MIILKPTHYVLIVKKISNSLQPHIINIPNSLQRHIKQPEKLHISNVHSPL